jgi:threonine aldolase
MKQREFRSDTMTRPSAAMRRAMAEAEVGDDVCGEDPTVNRLEATAAALLGKEAALFVPSGVFGNQCAIGVHCQPGNEAIVSEKAHVIEHEAGSAAALSGVQVRAVIPANGHYLTAADVAPRIRVGDDIHEPRTALILLENALSDGTVMPLEAMAEVAALARRHGIPVHLDGARIFNAALALGVEAADLAACCDTVSFCLSKGLGAPVGSLLCGPRAFVNLARRRRKVMGGGMRQVGVLAAPGLLALSEGRARLADDHRRARLLAEGLAAIPGVRVRLEDVVTNMVYIRLDLPGRTEPDCVAFLGSRGIRVYPPLPDGIRFVTSLEVGDEDVAAAVDALREFAARAAPPPRA